MNKKIQAIVKINGVETFYFYDKEIERIISTHVKLYLLKETKAVEEIETELVTPALTHQELQDREKNKE